MSWTVLQVAGWMIGIAGIILIGRAAVRLGRGWAYDWRHARHLITEVQRAGWGAGYELIGSMNLDDEQAYRHQLIPRGEWNDSTAESGADWEPRTALWNGHTFGCLRPDEDHEGACPEEGDWPDDQAWPAPDMPAAGPADMPPGPGVIDDVLAFEAMHPEAAEWTDKLLADLREAPTVLDGPLGAAVWTAAVDEAWQATEDAERLGDTGEIQLASLRAEFAAELRAQDDDAAVYVSRLRSDAAEFQLHFSR